MNDKKIHQTHFPMPDNWEGFKKKKETQMLSKTMQKILNKMEFGKRYSSYILQCRITTLQALASRGLVRCVNPGAVGCYFSPTTVLEWIKLGEKNER